MTLQQISYTMYLYKREVLNFNRSLKKVISRLNLGTPINISISGNSAEINFGYTYNHWQTTWNFYFFQLPGLIIYDAMPSVTFLLSFKVNTRHFLIISQWASSIMILLVLVNVMSICLSSFSWSCKKKTPSSFASPILLETFKPATPLTNSFLKCIQIVRYSYILV